METFSEKALSTRAKSIRARWGAAGHVAARNEVLIGGGISAERPNTAFPGGMYSGSEISDISADFLGDWRSGDAWMRYDLFRVRNRSRQLERGNPWCQSFKKSLVNNVLGAKGFNRSVDVRTSKRFGDSSEGQKDIGANTTIELSRKEFEKPQNFTTRKRMSSRDVDRLLLCRWFFDGEVIVQKIPSFDNDFGFTRQIIDPDYLDHNLNKVLPSGNIIRMGVELEKDWKYPVAYWFLHRRPNDYFYNYTAYQSQRYYRVPAEQIDHIFLQTMDPEQTRGFPLPFAAMLQLHRMGKYEEAALVNAAVSACRGMLFEKNFPDGFGATADEVEQLRENDGASIPTDLYPAMATELPYGVRAVSVDSQYPSGEYGPFSKAMLHGVASALGSSYPTLTGDLSEANFSSLKAGLAEEHEEWMQIQEFFIEHWKEPEYEDFIENAFLNGKIFLPVAKIQKFKSVVFTGRRWAGVNPVDDANADSQNIANHTTSVSQIIRERTNREPSELFAEIAQEQKEMKDLGISLDTVKTAIKSNVNADDVPPKTPMT